MDEIIERLLHVRDGRLVLPVQCAAHSTFGVASIRSNRPAPGSYGCRPGKQVQLAENEIRCICLMAKEIFMSQPNLLELEAPIKICGMW